MTSAGPPLLDNQLLRALPDDLYRVVAADLRTMTVALGEVLYDDGSAIREVYFPTGGVFSVTNLMRDGRVVEVATVGAEGMLGVNTVLGDRISTGVTMLQVPEGGGSVRAMSIDAFTRHANPPGPFRDVVSRYAQAFALQAMQSAACNALHSAEERCCRWLLQTHDRVGQDEFTLKHEFLAAMLGVSRPTVTIVMGTLQKAGLISTHYGRIHVLDRKNLEDSACECYASIIAHFERLGIGRR